MMNKFFKNSVLPKKIINFLLAVLISTSSSLVLLPKSVLADNLSWTTKANLLTARYGLGAAAGNNGRIYAIGGSYINNRYLKINEEYNPLNNTWTAKADMPTGRELVGAVKASDGKIYVIGGYSSGYLNTVEAYDPSNNTWTSLSSMPTRRYTLGVAATNDGKIYAIGGHNGNKLNTVEVYDIASDTWTSAASMPTPRAGLVAVIGSNGKIYALGGAPLNDAPIAINEKYDPSTNLWTTKAPMPTAKAYFAAVNASNGRIYAIGGRPTTDSTLTTSTVVSYDPNTDIWLNEASMPTPRQHFAAATIGIKIYALGGNNQINNIVSVLPTVEEATIVPDNFPPTIDAGGPYYVDEGETVQMTATGNDPENGPLTYEWDLDNNGSFETPGQTVTFSAATIEGPDTRTIRVRVTDNGNLTATDEATVNILALIDFYLHGTGPVNNPPTLFLDDISPTSATEKYRDSAGLSFGGGNTWKDIGLWDASPTLSSGILNSLSDLHVWLGLKNSDDIGTRFDLRGEIYKNGVLVASSETYCITGVVRNPASAKEVVGSFGSFSLVNYDGSTDELSLKLQTRIGTDGAGGFCGGHSGAVGLRLYFDSTDRTSRFHSVFAP